MSVNNSINNGSAATITLDTADLIVISDTSSSGALSTCEAQDIADLGPGIGAVAGVFPSSVVTFTEAESILYQYNVSSVVNEGGAIFTLNFSSAISATATVLGFTNSSSNFLIPGGCVNIGTSISAPYGSFDGDNYYFVSYNPA